VKNDLNFLLNKKDVMTDSGEQHYIGGTIMGNYYKLSVLDKNLKLHLTENLYFFDRLAHVFGKHPNPTFASLQFSCRLADQINKEFNEI